MNIQNRHLLDEVFAALERYLLNSWALHEARKDARTLRLKADASAAYTKMEALTYAMCPAGTPYGGVTHQAVMGKVISSDSSFARAEPGAFRDRILAWAKEFDRFYFTSSEGAQVW